MDDQLEAEPENTPAGPAGAPPVQRDLAPPPPDHPQGAPNPSELVDEVNELAEPPEGAVVGRQDEPRQPGERVPLLRRRAGRLRRRRFEGVAELALKGGGLRRLQPVREPEDQIVAYDP